MLEHRATLDRERFGALWTALGARHSDVWKVLADCYTESSRHYHTEEHIRECLAWFDRAQGLADRPLELEAAIWFHDVIYDTARLDNEMQSAELVLHRARAACIPADTADRIAALVLGTDHARSATTADQQLLSDIDLTILGASPERYRRYEQAIRQEYAAMPEDSFRIGRMHVLESFLERTAIYHVPFFYDRLERQARGNLAAAVRHLRPPTKSPASRNHRVCRGRSRGDRTR